MWLLIAFIAVPVLEIALFIQVGGFLGLWPTLLIVILTAILGTTLVRSQGALALGQVKSSFNNLNDPTEPLVHGAMILFAGALLLTPGFFTDGLGFAFLIPQIRSAVYKYVRARVNIQGFETHQTRPQQARSGQGDIIEGDFVEISENEPRQDGPSGWTKH